MEQLTPIYPNVLVAEQGFMRRVYNWMSAGLGLSALVAFYLMQNENLIVNILQNRVLFYGLFFGQLALVFWMSARIQTMTSTSATTAFFLYAGLNGITLSPIFLVYTGASISSTFLIAGATFGATSLYGALTKKDLSSMGSFFMMGLIGTIIASLVNVFFLKSSLMDWAISLIVVFLAVGLTAYDTQKIKALGLSGQLGEDDVQTRAAIFGALSLYLDFVMMFVHLLRIVGKRR